MNEIRGGRAPVKRLLEARPVVLLLCLMLVAAACIGNDDTKTGDERNECQFAGSTEVSEAEPVGGPFEVSKVRHEIVQPGCQERLAFILESLEDVDEPGYRVSYIEPPFLGPMGEIEVGGQALLLIILFEAHGGAEVSPAEDAELVVDIVKTPEVPGGSLWLVGLEEKRPLTVSVERAPDPALIVAIGAPGDS